MGGGISVEVKGDQESPSTPGQLSVLTEPLDDYCKFDDFWDKYMNIMRCPVLPMEHLVFKHPPEVVEQGEDEFTVKIVHDAAKISRYGFGHLLKDNKDIIRVWNQVKGSRSNCEIVVTELDEDGETVKARSMTRFLSLPFRVEFWCELADGTRKSSEGYAGYVSRAYVLPIVRELANTKVKVELTESPSSGKLVARSGELDEYLDYDTIFDTVIDLLKDQAEDSNMPGVLTELTDNSFEIVCSSPKVAGHEGGDTKMVNLVKHDRSQGEIINVVTMGDMGMYTSFMKIEQDPLIVEHWTDHHGDHVAGRKEEQTLQQFVDGIVTKAEGGGSWWW